MTFNPSTYTVAAKTSPTPRFLNVAGNGAASGKIQITQNFHRDLPETAGPAWLGFSLDTTGRAYHGFTLDTPEQVVREIFEQRYGRPAEFVFVLRGNLLCGPIPEVTP